MLASQVRSEEINTIKTMEKLMFYLNFSVRGGINELFACYFKQEETSSKKMYSIDMISSYTASTFEDLPYGNYMVFVVFVFTHYFQPF